MKVFIFALTLIASQAFASTTAPAKKIHFITPMNNQEVPQSFPVEFAATDMTVVKAGVMKPGTGHHHLIINGKAITKGQMVPKNETHIHYGDASTKTTLNLKPGKHTLTLQFADGNHISMGPEYSDTISVIVK